MTKATETSPKEEAEDAMISRRTRNAGRRESAAAEKEAVQVRKIQKERAKEKRQVKKSDWIPPLKRYLGSYQAQVNSPVSSLSSIDPVEFELRKVVGLVVKSLKDSPHFTQEFVDELAMLTSEYMHGLVTSLHKYTEAQRHQRPGISDLQLCLKAHELTPKDLNDEYQRTIALPQTLKNHAATINTQVNDLLREYYADNYNLEKDDPSLVFHANEQYEIAALVPRQSQRPAYIPEYLPDLPPDYTYQNTGNYMNTITELKQIMLKLVEESRLNEKSLYKLIEDDDRKWNKEFEEGLALLSDVDSDNEDIMSEPGDKMTDIESPIGDSVEKANGHDDETENNQEEKIIETSEASKESTEKGAATEITEPSELSGTTAEPVDLTQEEPLVPAVVNGKRFDFVEYARKRRVAKEREIKNVELRRRKRDRNVFQRAEKVYSCYAQAPPTAEDDKFFGDVLSNGFKRVIRATRLAEQQKKAKLTVLLQERARKEQEQEQNNGSFEFGFSFNPTAQFLDDSGDEAANEPAELDFGDDEPMAEVSVVQPIENGIHREVDDMEFELDNALGSAPNPDNDDIDGMFEEFLRGPVEQWGVPVGQPSEESEEDELVDL